MKPGFITDQKRTSAEAVTILLFDSGGRSCPPWDISCPTLVCRRPSLFLKRGRAKKRAARFLAMCAFEVVRDRFHVSIQPFLRDFTPPRARQPSPQEIQNLGAVTGCAAEERCCRCGIDFCFQTRQARLVQQEELSQGALFIAEIDAGKFHTHTLAPCQSTSG